MMLNLARRRILLTLVMGALLSVAIAVAAVSSLSHSYAVESKNSTISENATAAITSGRNGTANETAGEMSGIGVNGTIVDDCLISGQYLYSQLGNDTHHVTCPTMNQLLLNLTNSTGEDDENVNNSTGVHNGFNNFGINNGLSNTGNNNGNANIGNNNGNNNTGNNNGNANIGNNNGNNCGSSGNGNGNIGDNNGNSNGASTGSVVC
jgi:hypothetical protein